MSRYTVYITPRAWDEIKDLPGHIKSRVRRAISSFTDDPHPHGSTQLNMPGLEHELRRLRIDRWRIVYVVSETDKAVDVLAVRKRPPYDYGDLEELLKED